MDASTWLYPSDQHDGRNGQPNGAASPPSSHTALLGSDFVFGDMPGTSQGTSSISPPPQYHYPLSSQQPFFSNGSYGSYSWPSTSSHLPVSSYSTLNGATSSNDLPSTSHAQQHSPPPSSHPQPMMIDPSLTNISSLASHSPPPFMQSTASMPSPHSPTQQYHNSSAQFQQFQHLFQASGINLDLNGFNLLNTLAGQPSQPPQRTSSLSEVTLSPHALHSRSPPPPSTGISPSSFYSSGASLASTPTSTASTSQLDPAEEEARRVNLAQTVRPLLTSKSFSGAKHVQQLTGLLEDFGINLVETPLRLEILTRMRDNAGNHYFRAWSESAAAMDITREWLKSGLKGEDDEPIAETIMPLLQIIDRLPLSVESLKASKLGKIVVKLVKDAPSPAVKDMASNLERRWRQMVNPGETKPLDSKPEDAKGKKRKVEAVSVKSLPVAKKQATSIPGSSAVTANKIAVKKEVKPTITTTPAVKGAKSDSSFFSAPKPKPKLPSFKKAPGSAATASIAQPVAINPFQEALKDMNKRKASPAAPTPPPTLPGAGAAAQNAQSLGRVVKKRKSVTWPTEDKLESVKLIDRAIYDDDDLEGAQHSVRDLDRDEGAALHNHLFGELIDWFEPPLLEVEEPASERGLSSSERDAQAEREQTALGALYLLPSQIPDSPGEPSGPAAPDEVSEPESEPKPMVVGPEADSIFWRGTPPSTPGPPPTASVTDLIGQLAAGGRGEDVHMADAPNAPLAMQQALQNVNPEQLQQLLAMLQQGPGVPMQGQQGPMPGPNSDIPPSWPGQDAQPYGEYGFEQASQQQPRWEDSEHDGAGNGGGGGGWRGGRGRGRGKGGRTGERDFRHNKRKPCTFFLQGRCKFGDQCDFSHEPGY